MIHARLISTCVAAALLASVLACSGGSDPAPPPGPGMKLEGVAVSDSPMAGASISVYDTSGVQRTSTTDSQGEYSVDVDGLTAPLLIVAEGNDKQLVALLASMEGNASLVANVNALTDKIASDVATELGYSGPQALADTRRSSGVTADIVEAKAASLRQLILPLLTGANITEPDTFDPVTYPMKADYTGLHAVLEVIRHNRGSDPAKGQSAATRLYDPYLREVTTRYVGAAIDFAQWQADAKAMADPSIIRIFIAGDSTASNYDKVVAPRMGWGQTFHREIADSTKVKVVNVAQSGRSSRSFISEGWFDLIQSSIKQGDYLLVQFGHNDEKCGNEPPAPPPARDESDIASLCTYPNDAEGNPRYPTGRPEMSFQKSLEKYIFMARSAGATPVFITPVTRRPPQAGPFVRTHVTNKGLYFGDYSKTVMETAEDHQVPLVDLDTRSIEFFNGLPDSYNASLNYYLAVDPAVYPYYTETTTGSINKPDNTHFQESGAEAIAHIVAQGLKEDCNLESLAHLLK